MTRGGAFWGSSPASWGPADKRHEISGPPQARWKVVAGGPSSCLSTSQAGSHWYWLSLPRGLKHRRYAVGNVHIPTLLSPD